MGLRGEEGGESVVWMSYMRERHRKKDKRWLRSLLNKTLNTMQICKLDPVPRPANITK